MKWGKADRSSDKSGRVGSLRVQQRDDLLSNPAMRIPALESFVWGHLNTEIFDRNSVFWAGELAQGFNQMCTLFCGRLCGFPPRLPESR